jgi:hypothetical protein
MATFDEKLEKVQYLNNKNIDYVHKGYTGTITIHWLKGEPMEEEEKNKKKINLE